MGFSGGTSGKEPTCQCRRHKRHGFNLWVGKIPWRRAWQPTPLFLPGESHGQRSLMGYNPSADKSWTRLKRLSSSSSSMLSHFSHVLLLATPWTVAHQAPLSMGFFRQEYWSGLPCAPLGDLSGPGIEPATPTSSALRTDSLPTEPPG